MTKQTEIAKIKAEAAELDRRLVRRLNALAEEFGDIRKRDGKMAEEEFAAALRDKMAIGKSRLQEVLQNVKHRYKYDFVGINGGAVFVGEIKYRLTENKVRDYAQNRLSHFAEDFPQLAEGRKVYGMVGGILVDADAKRAAKELNLILLRLKSRALLAENAAAARPISRQ